MHLWGLKDATEVNNSKCCIESVSSTFKFHLLASSDMCHQRVAPAAKISFLIAADAVELAEVWPRAVLPFCNTSHSGMHHCQNSCSKLNVFTEKATHLQRCLGSQQQLRSLYRVVRCGLVQRSPAVLPQHSMALSNARLRGQLQKALTVSLMSSDALAANNCLTDSAELCAAAWCSAVLPHWPRTVCTHADTRTQ